jgi:hypothetical protein
VDDDCAGLTPLTSLERLINFLSMHILMGLLRMAIFLTTMTFLFVVAAFALLAGTLFFLLSGRRPRFQFRTTAWPAEYTRQPMRKDVTPQPQEKLNEI